ncbi:hypothetical protein [Kitasatospora sp. NPDC088346]|uniref:hypothetical protein n=1 Tax=Kitasatospora sp. NPDC088346 TaxID=3364073 RepID=UPI0038001BA3
MDTTEQQATGPDVAPTITAKELLAGAAAALTVTAVVIWFAGGVVLAARMQASGFRWGLVLSQMPAQVLREIAVSWVLLPSVAVAVVGYLLSHMAVPSGSRARRWFTLVFRRFPRGVFVFLTVLLVVPGIVTWHHFGSAIPEWWLIAPAAAVVIAYAMMLGAALQRTWRFRKAHRGVWAAAVVGATMLAAVPGAVVLAASMPLQNARACGGGYELDTLFIGAASDWIYLGEYSYDENGGKLPPQLVLVPTSRVNAVGVARGLGAADCLPTTGELGTTKAR